MSANSGSGPRTATARPPGLYDQLGLAEYEAIEGFVRWRPGWNEPGDGQAAQTAESATPARRLQPSYAVAQNAGHE